MASVARQYEEQNDQNVWKPEDVGPVSVQFNNQALIPANLPQYTLTEKETKPQGKDPKNYVEGQTPCPRCGHNACICKIIIKKKRPEDDPEEDLEIDDTIEDQNEDSEQDALEIDPGQTDFGERLSNLIKAGAPYKAARMIAGRLESANDETIDTALEQAMEAHLQMTAYGMDDAAEGLGQTLAAWGITTENAPGISNSATLSVSNTADLASSPAASAGPGGASGGPGGGGSGGPS